MAWQELVRGLCLVLVIEGLLPFAAPSYWRGLALGAAGLTDRRVRFTGFAMMAGGALLLRLFR